MSQAEADRAARAEAAKPAINQAAAEVAAAVLESGAKSGHLAENQLAALAQEAPAPVEAPARPVSMPDARVPVPQVAPVVQEQAQVAQDAENALALPSFAPLADEDLDRILEEPDFEDEIEAEIKAEKDALDPASFEGEYDENAQRELKRLTKRNAYLEDQLVAKSKKGWVAENLRKYPALAHYAKDEVEAIDATSRRQFAVQAAKLNDRYMKVLEPALADIAAMREKVAGVTKTEARQEVKAAWGTPPGELALSEGTEADTAIAAAIARAGVRGGDMSEVYKLMLQARPVIAPKEAS